MPLDDTARLLVGLLAAIVLLPFLVMALVMPFGMVGYAGGGMGGWVGVFGLVPLLILIVLVWLGYRLLTGDAGPDRAVEELREAYARGDLTTEEFEERLQRLENR